MTDLGLVLELALLTVLSLLVVYLLVLRERPPQRRETAEPRSKLVPPTPTGKGASR